MSSVTLEPLTIEHAAEMAEVLVSVELYRFTGGRPPTPTPRTAQLRSEGVARFVAHVHSGHDASMAARPVPRDGADRPDRRRGGAVDHPA